jgi:hypothetical protein
MNDPSQHDQPSWIQREWAAQERARREEHLALDASASDPLVRRYRLAAHALRQPLPDALPPDFAAQVAGSVRRVRQDVTDTRLEQVMLIGLCGLLGIVAMVIVSSYAGAWLPAMRAALPAPDLSNRWLLIFASCVGVSYLLGRGSARRLRRGPG